MSDYVDRILRTVPSEGVPVREPAAPVRGSVSR